MSSIFSTPWKDVSTTFARQLREPCKKLIDRVSNFKDRMDDKIIFSTMIKRDKEWQGYSRAYYDGIALLGDALGTTATLLPSAADHIFHGYGAMFTTIGAGAVIIGGMRGFFLEQYAKSVLGKRSKTSLFTRSDKSRNFHDLSALEYGFDKVDMFSQSLRKAESEGLEILKAARRIKRMQTYYQQCDKADDETHAVQYTRFEKSRVIGFDKIAENLTKAAKAGLENLDVAYKALTEFPESPLKIKLAGHFLDLAKQFEPETRMLPQSEVSDKSVWSGIHNLMEKCEALQCQTTKPASTASTNNVIHSQRLKHR